MGTTKLRILISRTDRIGDVVLTLPLAGYLKEHVPDVEIGFLCRSYTAPIVRACRYVDRILIWEESEKGVWKNEFSSYDVILHVFPSFSIALRGWASGISTRVGTSRRWYHWLFCNQRVPFSRRQSDLHEAQLNFHLLKPLGFKLVPSLTEIPRYYGLEPRESLPNWVTGLLRNDLFKLILHPGSKGSAPEWGIENFRALIQLLPLKQFQIFITGNEEEGRRFRDQFHFDGKKVIDLMGKLNLGELITFISHCDGVVAGSTGPLHLGAALGKLAIGLYTPRRPIHPGRWGPVGEKAYALVYDPTCKACSEGKPCDCIQKIAPKKVFELIKRSL